MRFAELLEKGGWTMAPIYLCSLVAVAVFVKKALEFRAARLNDVGWFDQVLSALKAGEWQKAGGATKNSVHPASRVVSSTITFLHEKPTRAAAEAQRVGSLEIQKLGRNLSLLSFIAQVAPLLGLPGTVLGMVDLFIGLQGTGLASVDVSQLSEGIWKALLTTAAGLLVAVPSLAGHSYLASKTDGLRLQLSDAVQQVMNEAPSGEG